MTVSKIYIMTRSRVLFTAVCSLLFLGIGFGQSVDQLIEFADEKVQQGQYELAAKEYQRALFFGPKDKVGPLSIATGDCYFEMRDYAGAERYYRFAANLIHNDSLKTEVLLKKSSCLLLDHQYQLAIFDLLNLAHSISPSLERKKSILLGVAYFGMNDFERSEKYFLSSASRDEAIMDEVSLLFDSKKLMRPNPNLAYWMSVILPGSGQFYSGDVKNGLNSMILSLGLAVLTYNMAINQSILDALMTIFPWWQRYYIGGYNSARQIAELKRQENRAEIFQIIYKTVREEE